MNKTIFTAMIVGLITGLIVGVLLRSVPALDNLVPDNLNGLITGGLAGAMAVIAVNRNKSS